MNPKLSKALIKAKKSIVKHSPEILTYTGIAGMITTAVLSAKGTTKAIRLLDERKKELEMDTLPVKDVLKTTWKCYIPATGTCVASIACILGAKSVNSKRNAALMAAYKFSEAALSEYKDKVVETIGEKKEKNIQDKIIDDRLEKNPASNSSVIITGKGTSLCYDTMNDRYFESSYEQIKKAENLINKELISSDYISLNGAYDELGLKHVESGDRLGWNISSLGKDLLEINISTHMSDDGRPCLSINFNTPPKYKFDMFY